MQPLGLAIDAERVERVQVVADIQGQIAELRDEFRASASNPNHQIRNELRGDAHTEEIVI